MSANIPASLRAREQACVDEIIKDMPRLRDADVVLASISDGQGDGRMVCKGEALLRRVVDTGVNQRLNITFIDVPTLEAAHAVKKVLADLSRQSRFVGHA